MTNAESEGSPMPGPKAHSPGGLAGPVRRLGVGGVQHVVVAAGARLLALGGAGVLLRKLSPQEYGAYSLAVLNEQVAFAILGVTLSSALGRFYSEAVRKERDENVVVGTTLVGMLSFALLGGVGWQLAAGPISRSTLGSAPDAVEITRVIGLSFMALLVLSAVTSIWLLAGNVRLFGAATIVQYGLSAPFGALIVVVFSSGPLGATIGYTLATVLAAMGSVAWALSRYQIRFDRRLLVEMLSYGWPIVPGALMMLVLQVNDRYFIRYFAGLETVGRYAALLMIATGLYAIIVAPFKRTWKMSMWAMRGQPNEEEFHRRVLVYYVAGQLFVLLVAATFGDLAMRLLAGTTGLYQTGGPIIAVVYSGSILFGMCDVFSAGYFFSGRTVFYAVAVAAATAAALAFNVVTVPVLGIWGAAVSVPVSFTVMAVISHRAGQRFFPVRHDWARIRKLLGGASLIGLVALMLRSHPGLLAGVTAAIVVSLFPVWICCVLDATERSYLMRFLVRWRGSYWKTRIN